jgi:hypothetical protein
LAEPSLGPSLGRAVGLIKAAPEILAHKKDPNDPYYARTKGIEKASNFPAKYAISRISIDGQETLTIHKLEKTEKIPSSLTGSHSPYINTYTQQKSGIPITPELRRMLNMQSKLLEKSKNIIDNTEHAFERVSKTQI